MQHIQASPESPPSSLSPLPKKRGACKPAPLQLSGGKTETPPKSGKAYPSSKSFPWSCLRTTSSPAPFDRRDGDRWSAPHPLSEEESLHFVRGDYREDFTTIRQALGHAGHGQKDTYFNINSALTYAHDLLLSGDLNAMFSNGTTETNDTFFLKLQERQKTCSGRDELCNSVLNDEWASHPTWASEDSGFIAHKKNLHEEGLHRIEEERHDYDYNIEACARTIQLLEPLATQLRNMSEQEQPSYKLPPGLGGQSETIYKRVIMKVYGRDKGQDVIQQLHLRPFQVVPVLLNRLKERLETWKLAQREWEKVWREQTQRMFWKSLDHQFVNTRASDKRAVQMKVLQAEIQMKHEEMKREDKQIPGVMHKPQLEYTLEDTDVILDLSHLLLVYIDQTMSTDTPRLLPFVKEFIPLFFGLDSDWFNTQINARLSATDTTSVNDATDDYASGADDSTPSRGRKPKSNNLLRSALDRGRGRPGRKDREDSNASASRASTPDVASNAEDEMAVDTAEESDAKQETSTARWLDHPASGNTFGDKSVNPGEQYARQTFRMWSNTPMYGFVRMFIMLYERLLKLKMGENECRETIKKAITPKPAADLGILDKMPQEFFDDISPNANYYRQMLDKFIRVFTGDVDFADVEETLRRFYLQSGYQLYSLDKIVQQLSRFATSVLNSEGKDKSYDIYQAFRRDRIKEFTTAQQQTDYRKTVEKMLRDGELYRVDYVS